MQARLVTYSQTDLTDTEAAVMASIMSLVVNDGSHAWTPEQQGLAADWLDHVQQDSPAAPYKQR